VIPEAPQPRVIPALTSTDKAVMAAVASADKLGQDTLVLDVGEVLGIVEYFVVTSASNTRQVRTITEDVADRIREAGGGRPIRTEGMGDLHWALLDFGDVVVHVVLDETREFYELERLWGDVPRLDWEEAATR
jgi:ribosome-associated protein